MPIAVATPLPPLNPKNIGNRWPRKAAIAVSAMSVEFVVSVIANTVGISPFNTSPANVIAAAFLPASLNTFVAPGFFEPQDLGSGSPISLQVMIAVESEPKRKAAIGSK